MSESSTLGFGAFIPGFDFLHKLGKAGNSSAGLPPFAHWVAPTVRVEEIEQRIAELKTVQFWLEQNSKALAATVQALEVQKMTLSTLQDMNVNLSDMAKAYPFAAAAGGEAGAPSVSDWPMSAAPAEAPQAPQPAAQPASTAPSAGMATAMQWWNALTQQFQQIAQQALQEPAQQQALLKATQMSSEWAQTAVKTASDMVRQAVVQQADAPASAATPRKRTATARKTSAAASSAVPQTASAGRKKPAVSAQAAPRATARKPQAR